MKNSRLFLLFAVFISLFILQRHVHSAASSPYDLIAAVNSLRQSNGLKTLETNDALMAAAQMQSDYLGNTYGTNFPAEWHVGAGGSSERDRAISAGYSVGPGWNVDEIAAGGNINMTPSDAVYSVWANSSVHYSVMTNSDNVHVGAGFTEGEGYRYFIVVFGIQYGSGGPPGDGPAATIPTTAVTPKVAPITVATPNADGSLYHEVDTLQTLWDIAIGYETTIDQLKALNNLSSDFIFTGQKILVRPAYTPTPSPTATQTPRPPTRTPIPAQSAQAIETSASEDESGSSGFLGMDQQAIGLALVLFCGIGLVLIVVGTMAKEKKSKQPPPE